MPARAPAAHPLIGRDMGNYTLQSVVGHGGMGSVFLAQHRFLGDTVAIKVLHGSFAGSEVVTERFLQEARSAREIGHPAVIKIVDFGRADDGSLYLAMELLDGKSLGEVLREAPLDEKAAARVAITVADGLQAAHEHGIIHRDLKPDNIFITVEGAVRILDFGIAKVLSAAGHTGTDALIGTPRYMAPEQARSAKLVGPPADIYALGALLFKMMTGRAPFDGSDMEELLTRTLFEPPVAPSSLLPEISSAMDALVLECLQKDPAARPASMAHVRERLRAIAGDGPLGFTVKKAVRSDGKTPSRPGSTSLPPAPSAPTTVTAANGELKRTLAGAAKKPARWPLWAGVAVLLAGAGSVGWLRMLRPHADATLAPVHSAPVVPAVAVPAAPSPLVVLRSLPVGATVSIDGVVRGITPLTLPLTGPTQIQLRLEGYRPTQEVLTRAGEVSIEMMALAPAPVARKPHVHGKPKSLPGGGLD